MEADGSNVSILARHLKGIGSAAPMSLSRAQAAVLFVLFILLASTFFCMFVSDDLSGDPVDRKQTITYHRNQDGSDTKSLSVSYYGIAATEYNPEFWVETLTGINTKNPGDVVGTIEPWIGKTETDVDVGVTKVKVHVQYTIELSGTKFLIDENDIGMVAGSPTKKEVIRREFGTSP